MLKVSDLWVLGSAKQCFRVIKLNEDDEISSVEKIERIEGEDEDTIIENENENEK